NTISEVKITVVGRSIHCYSIFIFTSRRQHTRFSRDWSSDVCSSDLGSGAMRMDYAILARAQLQSTSDQQNPLRYPPIAAAAPMAVLPEQAGNWAYPQPGMSLEEIAFCLVTGMAGRLYLSGHLDQMAPEQHALVAAGVATYRSLRTHLAQAVPYWPAGLPDWADPW